MRVEMMVPRISDLDQVVEALRSWQVDNGPLQLHPGDLGWYSTKGTAATCAALRVWSRGGEILAIGLLDGPDVLRMALEPDKFDDYDLAAQIAANVNDSHRGVFSAATAAIEARGARLLMSLLSEHGWRPDELWTPLRRELSSPVGVGDLRVESIGPDQANDWVSVHWSSFRGTPFTEQDRRDFVDRWLTMTGGPLSADARSLVAFDTHGSAVAVATVWSAGPGRPGLLEPVAVHRDHQRRGHGTAVVLAAAAELREMGASSAIVCTPSSNVGAILTYVAAGFVADADVPDMRRAN